MLSCISLKTTKALFAQNFFYANFLFVREKFLDFHIQIKHTTVVNMLADPLTKDLASEVFQNHVTHMGVISGGTTL